MLISPRLITTMLSVEVRDATDLEHYLARCFGLALLTIATMCIVLTGSVPLTSSLQEGITTDADDPKAPYAQPTLTITFLYHALCGFYSYAMWTSTGVLAYSIGVACSSTLAALALWCILFATTDGRVSRKTRADKRTSGFPFKNVEADKRKAGKRL